MDPRNMNVGNVVPGQNGAGILDPRLHNNLGPGLERGMGLATNVGGGINNAQFGGDFVNQAASTARTDFNAVPKSAANYSATIERSVSASSYSSQSLESTHQNLRYALGSVPWMKFKIVAEPDMNAFTNNPRLEAFIRSITETTMSRVTEDILAEFTATLQQAIQRTNETIATRLSTITESVIKQIASLTNIGGVATDVGVLDFGYSGGGNFDILGGGGGGGNFDILGGGGGGGNTDIRGGGGRGGGESGGGAVIDNYGKDHTDHCDKGDNCPCPHKDTRPVIHPDLEPQMVGPPNITKADWIWTKEVLVNPTPPGEARPFRKLIKTKCPVNRATVDITCDDYYTLYINGKLVGSSSIKSGGWCVAQRWTVEFTETDEVVIAVYAVQDPVGLAQVGLLAAGVVWHSQTQPPVPTSFITDGSWKTLSEDNFDRGFYNQKFDDGGWENAHSEGPYGPTAPWTNHVALPTKTETQNGVAWKNPHKGQPNSGNSVPDAPDAKPAKLVTSDSETSKAPTDKPTRDLRP